MSDSQTKQIHDIQTLLAERRKFEQWIAQLDARKDVTPAHVYAKVHGDYVARLTEAQARLSAESGAVQKLAGELEGKLGAQEGEIAAKRDERAEAELRAAVGEFSEKEWDKLRTKLDAAIAELSGERDGVQREMDSLRALLDEATGPAVVPERIERAAPAAVTEAPAPAPAVVAAPAAPDRKSVEVKAKEEPVQAVPPEAAKGDVDELAFLRSVLGRTTPYTAPGGQDIVPDLAATAPPAQAEPAPPAPRPPAAPRTSGAAAAPSRVSRASGAASAPRVSEEQFAMPEPPFEIPGAAESAASGGTSPRPSGSFGAPTPRTSEAVRSLKCQECGTLNFPTEWYCERCGGELAAF